MLVLAEDLAVGLLRFPDGGQHHGLSLTSALRIHRNAEISLDWLLAGHGSPEFGGEAESGEHPFEDEG